MKTSKRILSFFLAVVMVVSTCSVGFTAFAAKNNGAADSNNDYWNANPKATEAFDALNDLVDAYLPMLLNNPAIKETLETKLGMTITNETTINDLIGGASPLLVQLLIPQATKDQVIPNYTPLDDFKYGYLDNPNNKGMNFFQLYSFCTAFKSLSDKTNPAIQALQKYCETTLDGKDDPSTPDVDESKNSLNGLLNVYSDEMAEYGAYMETAVNQLDNVLMPWIDEAAQNAAGDIPPEELEQFVGEFYTLKPEYLGEYTINYDGVPTKLKDVPTTKVQELIDYMNASFVDVNSAYVIKDVPTLAYAVLVLMSVPFPSTSANGLYVVDLEKLLYLAIEGGAKFNTKAVSPTNVQEFNNTNYREVLKKVYTFDQFLDKYLAENGLSKEDYNTMTPFEKSVVDSAYEIAIYDKLSLCIFDINTDSGAIGSSNYDKMCKGLLKVVSPAGTDVNALIEKEYITDEQINAIHEVAVKEKWENNKKLDAYLKSGSCVLSPSAKTAISLLNGYDRSKLAEAFRNNTVKDVASTDGIVNLGSMKILDRVKYVIPSILCNNILGSDYNISIDASFSSYIDPANAYTALYDIKAVTSRIEAKGIIYDYENFKFEGVKDENGNIVVSHNDIMVEAANNKINGKIVQYLGNPIVNSVINSLLTTKVNLKNELFNIWGNLYTQPIETIFNLIPTITVLVDELIVPLVLTHPGSDSEGLNNLLKSFLLGESGPLYQYSQAAGNTTVGIGSLMFDLNLIAPAIVDWILGDHASADVAAVGTYTGDIYDNNVPKFTNVYAADKAIYGITVGQTLQDKLIATGMDAQTAKGLDEIITKVLTTVSGALDEYLAQHKDDERHTSKGKVAQKGLNNLFVAIPQLNDYIGKAVIANNNINSDWTSLYDGKIIEVQGKYLLKKWTDNQNSTLNNLKNLVKDDKDKDRPVKALNVFVDILIGNWLNSVLDFVNDTTADQNNKLTTELPLVFGLINSIGGIGEKSIISDVLNGLFQMKRSDEYSVALAKQDATGFVGFSNEAGLFLISNIHFKTESGEDRGIVPLIMSLSGKGANNAATAQANASSAPLAVNSKAVASRAASAYSELLTNENIALANDLVDKLDKIVSTLLSDITVNGKNITDLSGLDSTLINALIQAIGQENATDLVNKVLSEYIRIVTNETYDSDTLSAFVINTYAVIENIVDYLFYESNQPLLAQDSYRLVADAVTGLVSPDAVSVRMTEKDYGKTIEVLQTAEYLHWNDIKVKLDNGDKNLLKFNVSNEKEFNNALAESFNGISAIFAAILKDSLTTTGTNLYSEVYYPIIGGLLEGVMPAEEYNNVNTTNAQRLIGSFITPINNFIRSITKPNAKPVTEILNLIAGIAGVANDTTIANALNSVASVIDDEVDGVLNIVGSLSPTFKDKLASILIPASNVVKNLIKSFAYDSQGNQKQNIVMSIVNSQLASTGIQLPNFDFEALANTKGKPGETLLVLLDFAVTAITTDKVLDLLLQSKYPGLKDILKSLTATQIVEILNQVIDEVQDPTEIYWAFSQYANNLLGKFAYPQGIFPADAQKAVGQLDDIVKNIFPLLKELGVLNANSLADLVNGGLYTNANLTAIAKGLYNALSGEISAGVKIGDITKAFGIDPSPAGVAQYLNDTSYGATFSSAAQTLYGVGSWNDVKSINWGFTDGSGMAKTGFVNGLAAILRPFNNLLATLLVEGQLTVDVEGLVNTVSSINVTFNNGNLANGVLTINSNGNTIQIALVNTVKEIATIINEGRIHIGANGYESAIIPLLEAFMINNLKTYNDYVRDYNAAKDNLLINILNPVVGLIDKVVAAPFDTLTGVLPNVALFVDGYGVSQFLHNLFAPILSDNGIIGILNKNGINVDKIIAELLGQDLATFIQSKLGVNVGLRLELAKIDECNVHEILIPLVNSLLSNQGIVLDNIDWKQLASHGDLTTARSAAMNADGQYTTRQIVNVNKGEALIGILRYISNTLINNARSINKLLSGIDAIKNNATLKNILGCVFDQINLAQADDIIRAIFFFLLDEGNNAYFDYSNFKYEDFEFSFGNMDEEFCRQLAPMLDGLIGGVINLNDTVTKALYNDAMISTIATGLYKAVEGVKVSDQIGSLTNLLSLTGIDFSTTNVANLLVNEDYGQKYEDASKTIKSAGSWAKVNADSLKWGVTDRDTFLHALSAVLRPVYGVLDVLLNNGSLNLFNLVSIPGSDGYTSFLVPIMEAFGLYNIKTQYQYREDIFNEYDNILLDVLNPLFDKLEDIIAAPIQTLTDILPNLALVFANDGLIQIINNILTPVSAMLNAIRPIVDANKLLAALNVNIPSMLASIGIKGNFVVDVYDLPGTLTPLLGSASVTNLLNGILGTVKVGGAPLGVVLPEINWYQLASHGEVILDGTSQVACHGMRISVKSDQDETLIALLRFIVNTVNYENNYDAICGLVGGLIGGADPSVSDMVGQVLGMLQGDADAVIEDIVALLKDLAG